MPSAAPWDFLSHWTRRSQGPWPGETETEYLDRLLGPDGKADYSALAALKRILQQEKISSTSNAIRGGYAVVSFTAIPLCEWPARRIYRRHRGRWDFEFYGVCIRRECLELSGARAVIYGDEEDWGRLGGEERPYFQLRATRGAGDGAGIIWSDEQEWRHFGDVDLRPLAADEALVFVPTLEEAQTLGRLCRWPVVVVGQS
jgi:hypothetical protein